MSVGIRQTFTPFAACRAPEAAIALVPATWTGLADGRAGVGKHADASRKILSTARNERPVDPGLREARQSRAWVVRPRRPRPVGMDREADAAPALVDRTSCVDEHLGL